MNTDGGGTSKRWATAAAPAGLVTGAAVLRIRLLLTITRCWPAVGGAEIHTRELLRALGVQVDPVVVAHWDTNRTDWLLGTTVRAPRHARQYEDEGRPVRLIAPRLGDRLLGLPAVAGFYPFQRWAVRNLAGRLVPWLRDAMPTPSLVHNVRVGREP